MKPLDEDLLRIDNAIDYYHRWHKTKGLRKYALEVEKRKKLLEQSLFSCEYCGEQFSGHKIYKSMVHVNIEQEPKLKFFCCPQCKIKWSCMKL